ncbi:hypothetical protein Acsp01_31180 [Actinoplanes sp. NBRC 101535]|nr:hypothetical protein Acsp01_31180 [Actinoplanes sp. NBRC 101535]
MKGCGPAGPDSVPGTLSGAGADGTVVFWDAYAFLHEVEVLCGQVGELTAEEWQANAAWETPVPICS